MILRTSRQVIMLAKKNLVDWLHYCLCFLTYSESLSLCLLRNLRRQSASESQVAGKVSIANKARISIKTVCIQIRSLCL